MNALNHPPNVKPIPIIYPTQNESLQRVVAVSLARQKQGIEITLTSIELYPNGYVINYITRQNLGEWVHQFRQLFPILHCYIKDDKANTYASRPVNLELSLSEWRSITRVAPNLPEEVRELQIVVSGIEWITTKHNSETAEIFFQAGPWEFDIQL